MSYNKTTFALAPASKIECFYHRILRVARTIADLEGSVHTTTPHFAEAIRYRTLLKR